MMCMWGKFADRKQKQDTGEAKDEEAMFGGPASEAGAKRGEKLIVRRCAEFSAGR